MVRNKQVKILSLILRCKFWDGRGNGLIFDLLGDTLHHSVTETTFSEKRNGNWMKKQKGNIIINSCQQPQKIQCPIFL